MLEDPLAPRTPLRVSGAPSREDWTPIPLPLVEPGLPSCELRWERPIEGDGSGAVEIVCMATGGKRLAVKGGDESEMLATCGSCTIPRESARRPCLFLVPIKTERDGCVRDYFICRWFYRLRPEQPATTTSWLCVGCPYWFPRPPLHLLKDYGRATQKMLGYHQDVWEGRITRERLGFSPTSARPPDSQWRRLMRNLASFWHALWGLPSP